MTIARSAVELARTLRGNNRLKTRQPLAKAWLAVPGGDGTLPPELLEIVAEEINVKSVEPIADGSELVDRRVKVLLPKVGKRLGSAIPAVMAAARDGRVTFHDDGSVMIAGQTLSADEIEVQATPRPGTAVAEDDGLVMVLDTELTDELRAEGDARELARAVQDLRRDAGLELDDRIELWVEGVAPAVAVHLPNVARDTLAELRDGALPADAQRASVDLDAGPATIALRRLD
jgi:isoleucyl-tRNA synthetase